MFQDITAANFSIRCRYIFADIVANSHTNTVPSVAPTLSLTPTLSLKPSGIPTPTPTLLDASTIEFTIAVPVGPTAPSNIETPSALQYLFIYYLWNSVRVSNFSTTFSSMAKEYNYNSYTVNNETILRNMTISEVLRAEIISSSKFAIGPSPVPTLQPTALPTFLPTLSPSPHLPSPTGTPTNVPSMEPSHSPQAYHLRHLPQRRVACHAVTKNHPTISPT